jgi:phage FluMu protein Com
MPIREYKCSSCNLLTEDIIASSLEVPATKTCPRCKSVANFLFMPTSVSLGLSSFSEAPIDTMIGKDADRRWEDIHKRQEIRDKVRRESGSVGLTMVGRNEFAPISEEVKATRTELNGILPSSGYKPSFDSKEDAKLVQSEQN